MEVSFSLPSNAMSHVHRAPTFAVHRTPTLVTSTQRLGLGLGLGTGLGLGLGLGTGLGLGLGLGLALFEGLNNATRNHAVRANAAWK